MPSIEHTALKAIDDRELLLHRLYELLKYGASLSDFQAVEDLRHELADALAALRLAGVVVCETICRWRKRRGKSEPFIWRSHNYLLKMLVDSFFTGLSETISDAVADPFQLRYFPSQKDLLVSGSPKKAAGGSVMNNSNSEPTMRTHLRDRDPVAAARARVALQEARHVASIFVPDRKHTKHHIVRMWAAERILQAERVASRFEPIAPALEPSNVELRATARYLFFNESDGHSACGLLSVSTQ